jgi:hypothetical protein
MFYGAVISGSLGRALYRDGEQVWVLDKGAPAPRTAEPNDLSAFRNIAREVTLAHPDAAPISLEDLRARLDDEVSFFEALDFLLVGMDPDFSRGLRTEAISLANSVLGSDESLSLRIRIRFLRPANSQEWDTAGAERIAESIGAKGACRLYRLLAGGTVDWIMDDLNYLIGVHFGGGLEGQACRSAFLESGIIAELCDAS